MAVECLDASQQLAVVADRDQNLCVAAYGGLEDGQGAGAKFIFLEELDLVLSVERDLSVYLSSVAPRIWDWVGSSTRW